ncbi:adhesin [Haemophilus influenzae HK1212]|uniref:Adhesin n=1 Tax=Haemophilus influenzae HK1212 TaxID=456482 RepID=A0A7G2JY91_HAEIF|nr:adhesin [Haemophilus influenzae HK1212]
MVSELTRAHTKRASATVATAVLATLLSATVQASVGTGGTTGSNGSNAYGDTNNPTFNPANNSIADLNKQNDSVYNGLLNLNEKGADKKSLGG